MSLVRSRLIVGVTLLVTACASPPASKSTLPPTSPTPLPLSKYFPNIVEEDEYHVVERLPKSDYYKVDERHIRHPNLGNSVEIYKEDENYYYVYTKLISPENQAIDQALRALTPSQSPAASTTTTPAPTPTPAGPSLAEFQDISPARESGRIRLEEVKDSGLPQSGLWRASFVVADMNGDGIPDIVSPSPRLGDAKLHIWIGDGKGRFSPWPLQFIEDGKPNPAFSIDYGAVAVGDIDGDGRLDIVTASHAAGLISLFGEGNGTFRVVKAGLPTRNFSSQAIVLLDADGDGKLDIVASSDVFLGATDFHHVRLYLYRGESGWQYRPDGVVGGFFSNSMHAWDFDGDGKKDLLTGSHVLEGKTLLWRNLGNGQFQAVNFPEVRTYAYHFSTAPGTFGKARRPAFADAYYEVVTKPEDARATGIALYSFENGNWTRHDVWRKKSGKSSQYALAVGDLDGDGLDDVVFADSDLNRLRVFFQKPDGTFVEMAEKEEPAIDSIGQWIELADLDGDGRLDIILSKTVASYRPGDTGGWSVYLNRR